MICSLLLLTSTPRIPPQEGTAGEEETAARREEIGTADERGYTPPMSASDWIYRHRYSFGSDPAPPQRPPPDADPVSAAASRFAKRAGEAARWAGGGKALAPIPTTVRGNDGEAPDGGLSVMVTVPDDSSVTPQSLMQMARESSDPTVVIQLAPPFSTTVGGELWTFQAVTFHPQ